LILHAFKKKLLELLATGFVSVERFARPKTLGNSESVRNILILEYLIPLGNCVHMTPVFEALKRMRPDVRVSVATWGLAAQLLRNSPHIDDLIESPNPLKNFFAASYFLRRELRARNLKPDCCLTGVADQRAKIGLFGATVCSGWRGGLTLLPALYQRPLVHDRGISLIENNLRLAKLLGVYADSIEPKVFYSNSDAATARGHLEPARKSGRPVLVAVTRNSGGLPTAWHDDRWAKTLSYAHRELGYEIFYVGTEADRPAIAALRETADVGISLAGKTSITQLAALIALSDMVISLTTGTMHVTRAVRTPMVVLNIAWEKPLEWMPSTQPTIRVLQGPFIETVASDYRMDEISVDWVTSELAEMTKLFPPAEALRESRLQAGISGVDHLLL
jgi:ADP-heptose:LPS heptosyltransferase